MYPTTPPPPDHDRTRLGPPWPTVIATALLTLAAVAVGQRDWAVPERVLRGWQVEDVPSSLTALLIVVTAICLLVGAWATLKDATLRPRDPVSPCGWSCRCSPPRR